MAKTIRADNSRPFREWEARVVVDLTCVATILKDTIVTVVGGGLDSWTVRARDEKVEITMWGVKDHELEEIK